MRGLLLAALLMLGVSASGCLHLFDFLPEGAAESTRYPEVDRNQLWLHLKEVIHMHWRLKEIDEHEYTLQTRWEEHLGPMYQSGWRRQVNCWVYDTPEGRYFEVQVLKQVNMNIKNPGSAAAADWEDRGRDPKKEQAILYEVDVRIRPPEKEVTADNIGPKPSKYRFALEGDKKNKRRERLWGKPR